MVASEDGGQVSGFSLAYRSDVDRWVVAMPTADSATASVDAATSTSVPAAGTWTHLGVVFDGVNVALFVNGVREATVAHTVTWSATGNVILGRGRVAGVPAQFLGGSVDEARVYGRALAYGPTGGEVADIYRYTVATTPVGAWDFSETSGTSAADSSGGNHPLALSAGAGFTTGGHAGGGLALDGLAGNAVTAAPVARTDGSYTVAAWVKLSTDLNTATVVGQDGVNISGYALQYQPDFFGGQWVFSVPDRDTNAGSAVPTAAALSTPSPVTGWLHVTGSYDGFTHQLRLRVAGATGFYQQFQLNSSVPWNAGGRLRVGAGMTVDPASGLAGLVEFTPGVVDQVRVYGGVLSESDLRALEA